MASSSSSPQQYEDSFASEPPSKRIKSATSLYDVFINHRGSDVKQSLVRELYNSLEESNIRVFLDSAVLEFGETVPSTIANVIQSALVHIVIFSKHYAQSAWCLDELLLMLQTHATIIPVFYDVKPSEIRKQKGTYTDALTTYEKKGKHLDKLDKWREALQAVSKIDGYCKNHLDDSSLCKKIVSAVLRQLKKSFPSAKYPVGLDELVEDFEISCDLMRKKNESAKFVAIYGMTGIGKTTLAREIFNRKQREYEASSFLFDVSKKSGRGQLPSLQMKLVKDLLHETPPEIFDVTQGKSILKSRLRCHSPSFLMVLDDIDHVEQLDALVITNKLNQPGKNLVIITTSDEQILTWAGITDRYHLKKMDRKFGRKLFCCHAFHEAHASTGYEDLVESFVDVCEGLPLSLQVLGKNVYGKTRDNWQLELEKVSETLPQELKQKLRISFDSLNEDEKQIFMDIACFFVDKQKSVALRVWDGTGWSGLHALQNLKNKGLVEEVEQLSWNGPQWHDDRVSLRMHRHLRVMGREIADGIDFPRRLWRHQDLKSLAPFLLKELQLSGTFMEECPKLSGISKLEKLVLNAEEMPIDGWPLLESLGVHLTGLVLREDTLSGQLASNNTRKSKSFVLSNFKLKGLLALVTGVPGRSSLEKVEISKQNLVSVVIISGSHYKSIKSLKLYHMENLFEVDLSCLTKLKVLKLKNCSKLKSVSGMSDLAKLEVLAIRQCPQLNGLPSLSSLDRLERVVIDQFTNIGISKLSGDN
ncbi:disease resistance protein RUN1-like [Cryptomeria japonica]|uniref:disease resistance protein RUN1-like n=1 Tax=Cryptomeria japonica TaxID=3369 RepID=UPI0027DA72C2|nr:disease resistance protein RUN1-like [Cryptomeria japonica]